MKFNHLREGLFVQYENEQIFVNNHIYGRIMYMNESFVRILNYDDFHQFEFTKDEIESMQMKEIYGTDLKRYLVMRKDTLVELLEEIKEKHNKDIVDINYDLSRLDACIKDL